MTNSQPIGIFDSGLGGLTVVKAIQERLPHENIIYLGDTARVPYGNKSKILIQEYSLQIARFLMDRGSKLIVVACNTASSLALEELDARLDVPVIGVIHPGIKTALQTTRKGHIGVIGTLSTITSQAYSDGLQQADLTINVTSQACPLFVPLVEEGWLEGPVPEMVTRTYLEPLNAAGIDTLILGCTHYPLLKQVIQSQINSDTVLVDSAEAVAETISAALVNGGLKNAAPESGRLDCYVTDVPARFEAVAQRFLGLPVPNVSAIHLP